MNLESFIKESLIQIINGVRTANEELMEIQKKLPKCTKPENVKAPYEFKKDDEIEFDIVVSVKSDKKGKGDARFNLAVVEVDLGGGGSTSKENLSRVKFKVKTRFYQY